jgi:DNA polymerase I
MLIKDLAFAELWCLDFEFVSEPGERPDVVCLCAKELRSGQTLQLWRDQVGTQPPFRMGSDVLFISFVANAEVGCFLSLGWPLPNKVLDLSPAFRNLVNGRMTPEGKGLIGAQRWYGLDTMSSKHKDAMRDRVMKGLAIHSRRAQSNPALLSRRCDLTGEVTTVHPGGV